MLGESLPHLSITLGFLPCAGLKPTLGLAAGDENAGDALAAGLNAGEPLPWLRDAGKPEL